VAHSLPQLIRVTVDSDPGLPREGLLVGLTLRLGPRDYFSTLLGLTGADGTLTIRDADIAASFAHNQREFPMDYRVALGECDNAVVDLGGGRDFEKSQEVAADSPLVTQRFKAMWREARNSGIAPMSAPCPLDGTPVNVTLRARRIGLP
jgi:hypothetical protein